MTAFQIKECHIFDKNSLMAMMTGNKTNRNQISFEI